MSIGINHKRNINPSFSSGLRKKQKLLPDVMSQEITSKSDVLQKKFCM